eukprot:1176604-Rhodomonas_salina.2
MAYGGIILRAWFVIFGTDLAYGAVALRSCHTMCSTDLAYTATILRACYAMSGTDLAYAGHRTADLDTPRPMRPQNQVLISVRLPCSMSGTKLRYAATRLYWPATTNSSPRYANYAATRTYRYSAMCSAPTRFSAMCYAPMRALGYVRWCCRLSLCATGCTCLCSAAFLATWSTPPIARLPAAAVRYPYPEKKNPYLPLRTFYAIPSISIRACNLQKHQHNLPTRVLCNAQYRLCYPIMLFPVPHATCLRACYGMTGTDVGYGATSGSSAELPLAPRHSPRTPRYLPTRCPVLT